MTLNGWLAPLHRALTARGRQAQDAIQICHGVFDGWLKRLPGFVLRALRYKRGRETVTPPALERIVSRG